jgi:hypothetical protein
MSPNNIPIYAIFHTFAEIFFNAGQRPKNQRPPLLSYAEYTRTKERVRGYFYKMVKNSSAYEAAKKIRLRFSQTANEQLCKLKYGGEMRYSFDEKMGYKNNIAFFADFTSLFRI